MSLRVLVVQAETAHAQPLIRFFQARGDQVWEAWDLGQADSLASQVKPDLLVLDLHFPGDAWLKFLRQQQRRSPTLKVILTSRTPELQRELQAQALGLNVFLRHPFEPAWLQAALDRLDEKQPEPARRSPGRRSLPLWLKISLPYALLWLLLVLAAAWLLKPLQPAALVGLAVIGSLLAGGLGVLQARQLGRSIGQLQQASEEVANGSLSVKVDWQGGDEIARLGRTFNAMVAGLQEGAIYRDLTGRSLTADMRARLRQAFRSGELKLEGQARLASVLVSDLHGFTALCESHEADSVVQWLNDFYSRVLPVVTRSGGLVNQLDGDHLLAAFGVMENVLTVQQSALAACSAALDMLAAVNELNNERSARGEPVLVVGIGVNTGRLVSGGVGLPDRLYYSLLGDTVKTARRLEALSRQVSKESGILVSQATYEALGDQQVRFYFEPLGLRSVRGQAERVMVYRLQPARPAPKIELML